MKHYLNNAGASLMSRETLRAVVEHLELECDLGAYAAAQAVKEKTTGFYTKVAKLLNAAEPNEIAFIDSASRGWNLAIYGLELNPGESITTLSTEFGTNLVTLFDFAKKKRATINVIRCDETGSFDISEIQKALDHGTKAIAISHAAAQGSIVNPVAEIGTMVSEYKALYIVDGCQSIGQIPVDVRKIDCDVFIATGRKWIRGPRGTGFMYVKRKTPINATQIDLASAELCFDDNSQEVKDVSINQEAKRFELWERSIAGMLGLASAVDEYLSRDREKTNSQIRSKANRIREAVAQNGEFELIGQNDSPSGIVGFYLRNPKKESSLKQGLNDSGIGFSIMGDWDCPMAFPVNGATSIFRLSPHYYTDDDSVDCVIKIIKDFR